LVALFEVGAQATGLQVIRQDTVLFESQQPLGGHQLTQMIGAAFGLSQEEAESRKRSGDLPPDYQDTVLNPFVERLALEMARSLRIFFTSTAFDRVDHVLLAGGSAVLPGLESAVRRHTGTACQLVNPFHGVELGARLAIHRMVQEAPAYLTATGLALRRFFR
jgi:type IV pilus assembly protein PilM